MTDILKLAKQAHGPITGQWWDMDVAALQRFADLIRADEREKAQAAMPVAQFHCDNDIGHVVLLAHSGDQMLDGALLYTAAQAAHQERIRELEQRLVAADEIDTHMAARITELETAHQCCGEYGCDEGCCGTTKCLPSFKKAAHQEPVMVYNGRCTIDCGDGGHHDVTLLKLIPKGTKLFTSPPAHQEPVSLQSVHNTVTIECLNDKVMRQDALLRQALDTLDTVEALLTSMDVQHLIAYKEVDAAIAAIREAVK